MRREQTRTLVALNAQAGLGAIGQRCDSQRQQIMQARQTGLTKTYNRFHDPAETGADIAELRALHVEMDQAVAAAYGWDCSPGALDLGHGFHDTKQGLRYTLSEPARREVLDRLLRLNHERYAEEVAQGLHDRCVAKRRSRKRKQPDLGAGTLSGLQGSLF
jgi:DNA-binding GntR family transcriptional regulator